MPDIFYKKSEQINCRALYIEAETIMVDKLGHKLPGRQRGRAKNNVIAQVQAPFSPNKYILLRK